MLYLLAYFKPERAKVLCDSKNKLSCNFWIGKVPMGRKVYKKVLMFQGTNKI